MSDVIHHMVSYDQDLEEVDKVLADSALRNYVLTRTYAAIKLY